MRKLLLGLWLAIPVGAFAYHMGPGQDAMRLDQAQGLIVAAEQHVVSANELTVAENELAAKGEWAAAEEAFAEALGLLTDEQVTERRRLSLERAKCQMQISQLPEANAELSKLVEEMQLDPGANANLLRDARHTLANSEYYITWLMRLEGLGRDSWEPRIEAARQTFKLLAVEAAEAGNETLAMKSKEDLEAAIRLARMDLTELQGLPLPSQ
ncbi:MAG: hypothetical protein ACI9F9_000559 [Candidatus Paceibacteria bacterium]|jgi:hypothetical protein